MCADSCPIFELFADWNMAEVVTVIPWDLKEAYYCLNVCSLPLCVLLYLPVLGVTNKDCTYTEVLSSSDLGITG